MHLADAFIQSDYIAFKLQFTFYQLLLSLGIEPMILALLAPCSTIWATGKLYIPFSIHSTFQNMQAAHTVCTYEPPYHQRCWLLNWTLITRWKVSLLFSPEDTASVISNKNVKFGLRTGLTIEHFSTLKQSILNEPWPTGHNGASGPCSHTASFFHDRALVGICRWHGRLCLLTVVSGSIPGPI